MTGSPGIPRLTWWYATAAAIVAGAVYTLSPTTLVFLLVLPALFKWAQRELGPHERLWVRGLLGLAVSARLVALLGFFLSADHFTQPFAVLIGDERFIERRSLWALAMALGHSLFPGDYYGAFATYGEPGVLQSLLAYWQLWFGPAPYGAHLINVAMWLAGSIVLHRTARRAFGPLPALGGFALLLFMPTLFVWSISALKEPAYFLLTAATLSGAMAAIGRGVDVRRRVVGALVAVMAVTAISTLRAIALAATVGGLLVAVAGWWATRRAWIGVASVLLLSVAGVWAARQPAVQLRAKEEFRLAAIAHLGNVKTPGYAYRLLDSHFYTDAIPPHPTDMETGRFAIRAAASFFLVPLPWKAESRSALALLPQQLAWYLLVVLAAGGAVAGWRRDAAFTWLLVGSALVGTAAVAFYSGNVGTLVRMRDSVVPAIAWLSALGGCSVLESAARSSFQRIRDVHA